MEYISPGLDDWLIVCVLQVELQDPTEKTIRICFTRTSRISIDVLIGDERNASRLMQVA